MCMNPYNPGLKEKYLDKLFQSYNLTTDRTALWLEKNIPTLPGITNMSERIYNPFRDIPFIPGEVPLAKNTLPENAVFQISSN